MAVCAPLSPGCARHVHTHSPADDTQIVLHPHTPRTRRALTAPSHPQHTDRTSPSHHVPAPLASSCPAPPPARPCGCRRIGAPPHSTTHKHTQAHTRTALPAAPSHIETALDPPSSLDAVSPWPLPTRPLLERSAAPPPSHDPSRKPSAEASSHPAATQAVDHAHVTSHLRTRHLTWLSAPLSPPAAPDTCTHTALPTTPRSSFTHTRPAPAAPSLHPRIPSTPTGHRPHTTSRPPLPRPAPRRHQLVPVAAVASEHSPTPRHTSTHKHTHAQHRLQRHRASRPHSTPALLPGRRLTLVCADTSAPRAISSSAISARPQ